MSDFTAITTIIPTSTLEVLAKKIAKVNAKGGVFEYRVVGTTTIKRHFDYEGIPRIANIHASIVEVIGQQAGVDGAEWKFIAHLDHSTDPAVVTTASNDENIVAQYRYHAANCEHCKLDRNRRYTFIAENTTTGTRVQIGSTCLQAYFGNATAESLILLATWVRAIPKWFEDDEFTGTRTIIIPTMDYLIGAASCTLVQGFKRTDERHPTKFDAPWVIQHASDEAKELAVKSADWARSQNCGGSYILNIQAVLSGEFVNLNTKGPALGSLASLPNSYLRSLEQDKTETAREAARTEDCPTDSKRRTIAGTVLSLKYGDNMYGPTYRMTVITTGGYRVNGSVPQVIAEDVTVNDKVEFDAIIDQQKVDFGFYSRPTKASIVPE